MVSQALVSLGILKVNWDEKRSDYLENFVPFAAECVREASEDVVSATELQSAIAARFALHLPLAAIQSLLIRMKKRKMLRVESGVYYRELPELARASFPKRHDEVVDAFEKLTQEIVTFAQDRHKTTWSADQAGAALTDFLNQHHFLITLAEAEDKPFVAPDSPTNGHFITGSFVTATSNEPSISKALDTLAKATMLAEAIYLPEPASAARRFKGTSVYFDTPFLLFALGYAGEERREARSQLLKLLYSANADLFVFEHTLRECRSALMACAEVLERGQTRGYGPSMAFFLDEGIAGSDVRLFAGRLEQDLEALNVKVVPKPEYDSDYQVDEASLEAALRTGVGYRDDRPLQRDVDSISAIMRLRKGRRTKAVEDSRAIFVTTNQTLVRAANEHLRTEENIGAVAPCIGDYTLTSILWLKYPVVAPGLPRQRLLADCYAATEPSDTLWRKYTEEILRLERAGKYGADDVYLLRHSLEARHALMDATAGDVAAFSEGTISEILTEVKESLTEEARGAAADERARATEQEQRAASAEEELSKVREAALVRQNRLRGRAHRQAVLIVKVVRWLSVALLALATAYTFPWDLPRLGDSIAGYGLSALLLVLFVIVLINMVSGASLNSWLRTLETKLEELLYKRLDRIVG